MFPHRAKAHLIKFKKIYMEKLAISQSQYQASNTVPHNHKESENENTP